MRLPTHCNDILDLNLGNRYDLLPLSDCFALFVTADML